MEFSQLWIDRLSCGHKRKVETAAPFDRRSRVGEPTVCFECKADGKGSKAYMVTIEEVIQVPQN